jgi:Domain of unknown function (DUF6458)
VTIGAAIALATVGAILRYAIEDNISGINLATVGLILIIAGVVGFVAGLAMMLGGRDREREVVTRERDPYIR